MASQRKPEEALVRPRFAISMSAMRLQRMELREIFEFNN